MAKNFPPNPLYPAFTVFSVSSYLVPGARVLLFIYFFARTPEGIFFPEA